uniref:hypothetical protein n=1 Tax=Thermogymnomonas acidicola TaxID=399579 RepID=UPI001667DFB9
MLPCCCYHLQGLSLRELSRVLSQARHCISQYFPGELGPQGLKHLPAGVRLHTPAVLPHVLDQDLSGHVHRVQALQECFGVTVHLHPGDVEATPYSALHL